MVKEEAYHLGNFERSFDDVSTGQFLPDNFNLYQKASYQDDRENDELSMNLE